MNKYTATTTTFPLRLQCSSSCCFGFVFPSTPSITFTIIINKSEPLLIRSSSTRSQLKNGQRQQPSSDCRLFARRYAAKFTKQNDLRFPNPYSPSLSLPFLHPALIPPSAASIPNHPTCPMAVEA
ncbi:hypothetical protein NC652_016365 [Populus alba x Populus x berolinensis]|nr:hypothetical protein NC652_016365 [Populus alba x Populus x berolinensis]